MQPKICCFSIQVFFRDCLPPKKKNIYLLPWLSWFQWMTAMPLTPGTKCTISVLSCIFSDTLWRRTNIWWNDVSYKCRNRFNFSVFFQVCLHHCCNMKCKDVQIKKILHSGCEYVGIVLMQLQIFTNMQPAANVWFQVRKLGFKS